MIPRRFRTRFRRCRAALLAPAVAALALAVAGPAARAGEVTVFAAASLKTALDEVGRDYRAARGHRVVAVLAASSALARQIAQGAPADLFLSANAAWMDRLARDRLIEPASRVDLLGNRLVLIAPGQAGPPVPLTPGFDLAARLGRDGRLAIAFTEAVPAGIYAKAALVSLGLWPSVRGRLAQADNVRTALAFVARGEAALGLVYATDARAEPRVGVLATVPAEHHPPIVYPAAAVAASGNPLKHDFLAWLRSGAARLVFERHGFDVPAGRG